ncbi:cytochrome P450 2J2-like [Strongylocentrotus purpuratus]|uniref:Uncharacterized protein n=1 Tax=Strongylocentrotus purpuratus TaxID=7668 RepID=A0A7M7PQV9_STRPU|nr:cytochrome P450 2J2-like [Strongylocentrotus purpuratus]
MAMISLLAVGYFIKTRGSRFPAGPLGVPVLGYLPFLDCRRLHRSLMSLGRRYGNVFSLKIGAQTVVVLNSADVIRECLVGKATSFDGRPVWMLNKVNQGRGIANEQPTKKWQAHRKAWSKVTRSLTLHDLDMEGKISHDIARILSVLESSQGHPIDVSKTVHMALCNIICSLCFGKSFSYNDLDFQHLLKMADKFFCYLSSASAVNFFPILWYLPLKANKAVAEGYEGIFGFVKNLVEEKEDGVGRTQDRGFIDVCLDEAKSKKNCDGVKMRSKKTSADMPGRNIDLSTETKADNRNDSTFSAASHCHQPCGNGKACKEMDVEDENDVLETLDKYSRRVICEDATYVATDMFIGGAETTHAGMGVDTYACLQEILRLGNVIPIAIPHVTTHDVTMSNGCHLPQGTTVLSNLYACHMDPSAWESPTEFRPERFLDSEGNPKRFDHFMPFSIGKDDAVDVLVPSTIYPIPVVRSDISNTRGTIP